MQILVFNSGSSSLKFKLFEAVGPAELKLLAKGLVYSFGPSALCTWTVNGNENETRTIINDHREATGWVFELLQATALPPGSLLDAISAVGHRVVHGGHRFKSAVLVDDEVIAAIEAASDLAPLHNPPCVTGIRAARSALGPRVPMVAVFDTAFHRTLPDRASFYAIPYELSLRHGVRRYGFHGIAHHHLALRYAELTGTPSEQVDIVTLHLGNGCSATAVRGGKSVDTSMGFTPLEGLVMGTRCGDIDPSLVCRLAEREGVCAAVVESWLNTRSGLLGLSGRSHDMRELLERAAGGDARCRLAVEMFCYRARKYLGAYLAVVGAAKAVVFSGGIGENAPSIRARICEGMEWCGLELDPERNAVVAGSEGRISKATARVHAYVIAGDEEGLIARETVRLVETAGASC